MITYYLYRLLGLGQYEYVTCGSFIDCGDNVSAEWYEWVQCSKGYTCGQFLLTIIPPRLIFSKEEMNNAILSYQRRDSE